MLETYSTTTYSVSGTSISFVVQSHRGVGGGSGSLETLVAKARGARENDLAFGKTVLASSESDSQGGRSGNQGVTYSLITSDHLHPGKAGSGRFNNP